MPRGSTHDRITLWTAPGVTLLAGWLTHSTTVALAVGSAYLFSGLMFSGDLDTHSRQYQRWLFLRWIWLPYRRWMRHRSLWSHGPILGTAGRVLYLGLWLGGLSLLGASLGSALGWWPWQPGLWCRHLGHLLQVQAELLFWIGVGLELGSINHSLSDWVLSLWRRWRKQRTSCSPPGGLRRPGSQMMLKVGQGEAGKKKPRSALSTQPILFSAPSRGGCKGTYSHGKLRLDCDWRRDHRGSPQL